MDSVNLTRATVSAGVWFATVYALFLATGASTDLMNTAADAGIMAAACVVSDAAHGAMGMVPTGVTSHLATGAGYAAVQKLVRGDNNYMVNVGAAAANDYLVEKWDEMRKRQAWVAAAQAGEEEY